MKPLFVLGLIVLILGVLSFVVPIPHRDRQGVTIAGLSLGLETRTEEKLPPIIGVVMVAGGIAAVIAGTRPSSR